MKVKDKEKDRKEKRNKKVGESKRWRKKKEKKTKECLFVQELLKILRKKSLKWASQIINKFFFQNTIWFLKLSSSYNLGYSKHTFSHIKWSNSTCYNDKFLPICQI